MTTNTLLDTKREHDRLRTIYLKQLVAMRLQRDLARRLRLVA